MRRSIKNTKSKENTTEYRNTRRTIEYKSKRINKNIYIYICVNTKSKKNTKNIYRCTNIFFNKIPKMPQNIEKVKKIPQNTKIQ